MKFRHIMTFSLLCAVLPLGCAKQEIAEPEVDPAGEEQVEEPYSYDFAIDSEDTKTVFGEDHMVWEEGDLVGYYFEHSGSQSANRSAEVWKNTDGKAYVTIRSSVALAKGDMVYAYYPYSSDNDGKKASEVTLELVRNQNPADGDSMPMVALPYTIGNTSSDENDCRLRFLSLGSIVKVNIYSSNTFYQNEPINSVCFDAESPVSGTFTYNTTTPSLSNVPAITGLAGEDVTASPEGASVGTTLEDAASFLFVVAPGSYKGNIVVTTSRATYTYVSSSTREYVRASVKPFNIDLERATWTPNVIIDTPQKLVNFLATTNANDKTVYDITEDLNMSGMTVPEATGFAGTLNGNGHRIYNIQSSNCLFDTNRGTFNDLTIEGEFSNSSYTFYGALVSTDEGGTFNNVVNKANVTRTTTKDITKGIGVGGFVGTTTGGTFTNCRNEGAVSLSAAGYSHYALGLGGFAGYTVGHATFNGCTNAGPVSLTAKYAKPLNTLRVPGHSDDVKHIGVGGYVGYALSAAVSSETEAKNGALSITSCNNASTGTVVVNYTDISEFGTSGTGIIDIGGALGMGYGYIYKFTNDADVESRTVSPSGVQSKNECVIRTGGILGAAFKYVYVGSCKMNGNVVYVNDCSYDYANVKASAGGIAGCGGYNGVEKNGQADIYFCSMSGNITASGKGCNISVGGIIGHNGKQKKNEVRSSCTIDCSLSGGAVYVGGLVGTVVGGAANYTVEACSCAATITGTSSSSSLRVGGLLGQWGGATGTGSNASMTSRQDSGDPAPVPCSFSGKIISNQSKYIGVVVGQVNGGTVDFGKASYPIQVSGTFKRGNMQAAVPITDENIGTYKEGTSSTGTRKYYFEGPKSLKLMSFNISSGTQWTADRKAAIAEMFADQLPDVVGLQGVRTASWSDVDASAAGYTGYFPDSGSNNAFLFRTARVTASGMGYFELRDDSCEPGVSWDGYVRDVIYATLHDVSTGQDWFCVSTHLPVNNLDDAQVKAVNLILDRISVLNTGNYPVILIGDFNCVDSSPACTILKGTLNNTRTYAKNYADESHRTMYTYNAYGDSSKERNMVDHIWVSNSIPYIKLYFYMTLTQELYEYGDKTVVPYLSDHYPVMTYLNPLDI